MLLQAMNSYVIGSRDLKEQEKAQYTDKGDIKNYFRASELGSADRKIMYGFFKHQIPTRTKSAKNLRQLANGDSMHARYQSWWEEMGALISMEERLTSKDDEYLAQYDWEWAGHYDGLLDINVLKAHAKGLCTLSRVQNPDTNAWEIEVDIDEAYAQELGIFNEDYVPLTMVVDLKTMNPWGFKRIAKGDVSEIRGYIDQISFYMYMLNTPYGSIYVEDKGSNDVVEIQVVWHDMHEGSAYTFDPEIHGEQVDGVVRVSIDTERFFGSETAEGVVQRVDRLWETKKLLEQAQLDGSVDMAEVMPPRCSEEPGKFPCSWGEGKEKCEFFDHCWNQFTDGIAIVGWEACPEECKWEVADNFGELKVIDSRKVPQGVTKEALQSLVAIGALSLDAFLIEDTASLDLAEASQNALNADNLFDASGELNVGPTPVGNTPPSNVTAFPGTADQQQQPAAGGASTPQTLKGIKAGTTAAASQSAAAANVPPNTAIEYINKDHKKAIKCLNCSKENTYQRLANGGTKKCDFCNHVNKVMKVPN